MFYLDSCKALNTKEKKLTHESHLCMQAAAHQLRQAPSTSSLQLYGLEQLSISWAAPHQLMNSCSLQSGVLRRTNSSDDFLQNITLETVIQQVIHSVSAVKERRSGVGWPAESWCHPCYAIPTSESELQLSIISIPRFVPPTSFQLRLCSVPHVSEETENWCCWWSWEWLSQQPWKIQSILCNEHMSLHKLNPPQMTEAKKPDFYLQRSVVKSGPEPADSDNELPNCLHVSTVNHKKHHFNAQTWQLRVWISWLC